MTEAGGGDYLANGRRPPPPLPGPLRGQLVCTQTKVCAAITQIQPPILYQEQGMGDGEWGVLGYHGNHA